MKKFLLVMCAVFLFGTSSSVFAQSWRVQNLAEQIQRDADDLAENLYDDYSRSSYASRSDLDNLFLAQQIKASAEVFARMVQDRRRESELRDAAAILADLSRRVPTYGSNSYRWRDVQRSIGDLSREFGGGSGSGNGNWDDDRGIIGRIRWKGMVDDEVRLRISPKSTEVQTISGSDNGQGNFDVTTQFPDRKVNVEVRKRKGRGDVKILQNPNRDNGFTTVIQIRDRDGGAKEYDIELVWRQ
jgi:hypothetical protein